MKLSLRYGRGSLDFLAPDDADVTVIRKPQMPLLRDPDAAVNTALSAPASSPPLRDLARGKRTACIAICDITRPVPNHLFLRPLIQTLIDAGLARENILVLVATGLHRPNVGDELAELIGDPWVLDHVPVANHDARSDADHLDLGRTPTRGTVARIDKRFVSADLRIVSGLVEPHFMAGFSGGRKVVAPGLAHAETITTFHSSRFMADPLACNCNLAGNPLHEEQIEIVKMIGDVFAINTVIDEARSLSFVNFGRVVESHDAAVEFVRGYCEVTVPRRYPTVVTSAAGYPLDKTYYQTVKGMVGPLQIVQPGGTLVIASECEEGLGSADFVAAQRRLLRQGSDAFLKSIMEKRHADIDEWQTQMQLKATSLAGVQLYSSGLTAADRKLTGVDTVDSLERAIESSLKRANDRSLAVIPEGPYVIPVCDRLSLDDRVVS